jgi:hypothetical protein
MTVYVAFPAQREGEVLVEELESGASVFRAACEAGEPRVWQTTNNTDRPVAYRILARHKMDNTAGSPSWVLSADQVLFTCDVTRVIGYRDGGGEDYRDAVATVVWH